MTFLNPLMLFGLLAASIPVLIHLLNLRKLRTVDFSSIRFLKELQKSSIRRVRIRQWLLLALRTLLVVFLVIAFSRPALRTSLAGLLGGRASTAMVIVLDDTPSMATRDERGGLFPQAKDAVLRIITHAEEGDAVSLMRMSELGTPILLRHKEDVPGLLRTMEPSAVRHGYREALDSAGALLHRAGTVNRELYLVTDGQATELRHDSSQTLAPLGEGIRGIVVATGGTPRANAGVTSVDVRSRIIIPGRPVQVEATIRNSGAAALHNLGVSVYLDSVRVAQQSVDIAAGGSAAVAARVVPRRSGALRGSVTIDDDDLEADNRRFFALTIPPRIRVLLVSSAPADARYIAAALALGGDSSYAGLFAVRGMEEAGFPGADLRDFDVIVLSNIRGVAPATAEQLARFLRAGGGLLFFPGPETDVPSCNAALFPLLGIPPLQVAPPPIGTGHASPVTSGNSPRAGGPATLAWGAIDFEHPVLEGIFEGKPGQQRRELESPQIRVAFGLTLGGTGHAIIRLSNGMPFLADYPVGEGRVLLAAVDAGMHGSDFPYHGLFAPMLHRALLYLGPRSTPAGETLAGFPLEARVRLPPGGGAESFVITSPSGVDEKVTPRFSPVTGTALFGSRQTQEPGVYLLRRSTDPRVPSLAAPLAALPVNLDSLESNLARATEDSLRSFLITAGIPASRVSVVPANSDLAGLIEESRYGVELWRHFLIAALLCALLEMAVSRAGRRDATPPERTNPNPQ